MRPHSLFAQFRDTIASLPSVGLLTKEELLIDDLKIAQQGSIAMYYAPHNDVLMSDAKLIIAGLTPGFQQMQIALAEAQAAIWRGASEEEACMRAKQQARFAGTMRQHLIQMLDELMLNERLELDSVEQLFQEQAHWLHSTSVLPYPVFVAGKNYTGSQPSLIKDTWLRSYALQHMEQQLELLSELPIVPLGRNVEAICKLLVERGKLAQDKVLWGFPHPSGANGHRMKQFTAHVDEMKQQIQSWSL